MGFAPTIQVLLENVYNANQFSVLLYSVVASKLSLPPSRKTSSFLSLTLRLSPTRPARSLICTPTNKLSPMRAQGSLPRPLFSYNGFANFYQEEIMLKQQTVPTSLGQLTVSSLTLGELRQLDSLFQEKPSAENSGLASLLRYLPVIQNAVRKVHQDLTAEQLENGLTFDDFNVLFNAMLEVSGLKKAAAGEPTPVPV